MDFQALLYDPTFLALGVPATVELDSATLEFTALDKTAGIDVGTDGPMVQTILPAAVLRAADLLDLSVEPDDLVGQTITFNGFSWRISSYRLRPSIYGERDGEVALILSDKMEAASDSGP